LTFHRLVDLAFDELLLLDLNKMRLYLLQVQVLIVDLDFEFESCLLFSLKQIRPRQSLLSYLFCEVLSGAFRRGIVKVRGVLPKIENWLFGVIHGRVDDEVV